MYKNTQVVDTYKADKTFTVPEQSYHLLCSPNNQRIIHGVVYTKFSQFLQYRGCLFTFDNKFFLYDTSQLKCYKTLSNPKAKQPRHDTSYKCNDTQIMPLLYVSTNCRERILSMRFKVETVTQLRHLFRLSQTAIWMDVYRYAKVASDFKWPRPHILTA